MSAHRYLYCIDVMNEEEIDAQLLGWIHEAHHRKRLPGFVQATKAPRHPGMATITEMKHMAFVLLLVLFGFQCRQRDETYLTQFPGVHDSPLSILKEHENLLSQMQTFTLFQDSTGRVAIRLYELIHHHFSEEENFVLPSLAALPLLASGQSPDQHEKLLLMTKKLKTQLPHMNAEHQMIKVQLEELKEVASLEGHSLPVEFEKDLHRHARLEEEVFFPASILVGEYLKLQHK